MRFYSDYQTQFYLIFCVLKKICKKMQLINIQYFDCRKQSRRKNMENFALFSLQKIQLDIISPFFDNVRRYIKKKDELNYNSVLFSIVSKFRLSRKINLASVSVGSVCFASFGQITR